MSCNRMHFSAVADSAIRLEFPLTANALRRSPHMNPFDAKENFRADRRRLMGSLATAAGVSTAAMLGMNAPAVSAAPSEPEAPEEIFALSRLRNYKNLRSSSWDRTGGT